MRTRILGAMASSSTNTHDIAQRPYMACGHGREQGPYTIVDGQLVGLLDLRASLQAQSHHRPIPMVD